MRFLESGFSRKVSVSENSLQSNAQLYAECLCFKLFFKRCYRLPLYHISFKLVIQTALYKNHLKIIITEIKHLTCILCRL